MEQLMMVWNGMGLEAKILLGIIVFSACASFGKNK